MKPRIVHQPRDVIASIRSEEYMVDVDGSDTIKRGVKNLHRKLHNALKLLSDDLYSKKTHFLLELVQNADDNKYGPGINPGLSIELTKERLVVTNNEIGFAEENVRALCSVGESSKAKKTGYIGEKGIGFKSVFTVSDCPEIHSNGFHFRFDHRGADNLLGYVVPQWVELHASLDPEVTTIVLPSKEGYSFEEALIADLEPNLLLFLGKLRRLALKVGSNSTEFLRCDESGLTLLRTERRQNGQILETSDSKYVRVEEHVSMLDAPDEKREGIKESAVVLAFPVDEEGAALPKLDCATYAFLPIRAFGFKFCIQADFLLSSSREDVHTDRSWNIRLRNLIADVFVAAVERFKTTEKLALTYLRYLPQESDIVDAFFKPVAEKIVERLKETPCLLGQTGVWRKPSDVLLASQEFQALIPASDALNLFGAEYLDKRFEADDATLKRLGCRPVKLTDVVSLFSRHGEWLHQKDKDWLSRFYVYLSKRDFSSLRTAGFLKSPCIPTSDGTFVIPDKVHIFYPLTSRKKYGFEDELKILDEELMECATSHSEDIQQFFDEIGVKVADAYELVTSHILPRHAGEAWKKSKHEALIGHLRYIKDKQDKYFDGALARGISQEIALQHLRDGLWVGTKKMVEGSWTFNRSNNLYFSKEYRPIFSIEDILGGAIELSNLVATEYLSSRARKGENDDDEISSWRLFLKKLGVNEAPRVIKLGDGDYYPSKELKALIDSEESGVRRELLECLDRNWDAYAHCLSYWHTAGRSKVHKETGFVNALRSMRAPTKKHTSAPLCKAYLRTQEIVDLFGQSVTYIDAGVTCEGLLKAAEITCRVDTASCIKRLRQLKTDGGATIAILKKVYRQLEKLCDGEPNVVKQAFTSEPLIWVKGHQPEWLLPDRATWNSNGPFIDGLYPPLQVPYKDFHAFFVKRLSVPSEPSTARMVRALLSLERIESLQERKAEALRIYKRATRDLNLKFSRGDYNEPEWLDDFKNEEVFIAQNGCTYDKDNIYVNDLPSIGELFESTDDVNMLSVPLHELPKIRRLLEWSDVPYLSSCVEIQVDDIEPGTLHERLTSAIGRAYTGVARVLYHYSPEKFETALETGLFRRLYSLQVFEVPDLKLNIRLADAEVVTTGDVAFASERFLVRVGARSIKDRISQEICKFLSAPESLGDTISRLLLAETADDAEDFLKVKNIGPLPAEDEAALNGQSTTSLVLTGSNESLDVAREDAVEEGEPDEASDALDNGSHVDTPSASLNIDSRLRKIGSPSTSTRNDEATVVSGAESSGPNVSRTIAPDSSKSDQTSQTSEATRTTRTETSARDSKILSRLLAPDISSRMASEVHQILTPNRHFSLEGKPSSATQASTHSRSSRSLSSSRRSSKHAVQTRHGRLLSYAESHRDTHTDGANSDADNTSTSMRDETARAAVDFFLETQKGRWRSLEEMPHNNPGFDIRAIAHDGHEEVIEIKGQSGPWTEIGVALTPTELACAQKLRDRYWLCVVQYASDKNRRQLFLVKDPFGLTTQFRFDSGWKSQAIKAVFKSVNGIAAVLEPASGVAVTDFANHLGECQIQRFTSPGLHAA